jgi:hypothetical protein
MRKITRDFKNESSISIKKVEIFYNRVGFSKNLSIAGLYTLRLL